jgi:hypothetical protein
MARLWLGFGLGVFPDLHIINIIASKRWGEILSFGLWLLDNE